MPELQVSIITGPNDPPRIQIIDTAALLRNEMGVVLDLDLAEAQALVESLLGACDYVEGLMHDGANGSVM